MAARIEWRNEDGVATAVGLDGATWSGTVDSGAAVATVLPVTASDDAIVLLDPDVLPAGVEKWHPFFNLLRVSPSGSVRWRAELVPGDTWKRYLAVEWFGGVLQARASSHVCTIDPDSGRVIEATFTK